MATTTNDFTKDHTLATALSLLRTWWAMNEAERELCDLPRLEDTAIALAYMGCGASCQVYAKDIRLIVEIDARRFSEQHNWAWPQLIRISEQCRIGYLETAEEIADAVIIRHLKLVKSLEVISEHLVDQDVVREIQALIKGDYSDTPKDSTAG